MNKTVHELLNSQIQKELYSAYIYLGMSDYYAEEGLDGFANWFYIQAQEEMSHAMLFRTYLTNCGCCITLQPIDAPLVQKANFGEPLAQALEHEQYVTASIYAIHEAAAEAKDYLTMNFLEWFIEEQGEEEKNAGDLVKKYELFGTDKGGLYQLDQELKARSYSPPSAPLAQED